MSKLVVILILILGLAGFTLTGGLARPAALAPAAAQTRGNLPKPQAGWLVQDLEQAIAQVQPVLQRYGYAALFVTILVEGFGIFAPGQTFLVAAAVMAAQGDLNLIWVLVSALGAAILGNSLGYLLGRWGGRSLLAWFKVSRDRLAWLEEKFRRYGPSLVLLARFFEGLRQLNGIVAGILEMPWRIFTVVNVLGAVFWVGVWGLGPYYLGKEINQLHIAYRTMAPWAVAFSLIAFLALIIYLLRRRRTG